MSVFIDDYGDYYDNVKWDFPENNIPIYFIGKYPYKAKNEKNAKILHSLRLQINELCKNLIHYRSEWSKNNNQEYIDGVDIFLDLHSENYHDHWNLPEPFFSIAQNGHPTSKYLLSEIKFGTGFNGLNKPKMRHLNHSVPSVGKDGNGRALYRDIFLDLNRTPKSLEKLVIHELAHSMANHINFRPNDHGRDFKWAEDLIKYYWT